MLPIEKHNKTLIFINFIGFALIIRGIVDFFMDEPINIKLTITGVVILLIGIYLSRRLMPK